MSSTNTNFENDPPNSSNSSLNNDMTNTGNNSVGGQSNTNSSKALLTQEFHTIPIVSNSVATSSTTTTRTTNNNSISSNSPYSLYSADSMNSASSLPFIITPEEASSNLNGIPAAPAFIYHPIPTQIISPDQYYMMMVHGHGHVGMNFQGVGVNGNPYVNNMHNIHNNNIRPPLISNHPTSKRIKLSTDNIRSSSSSYLVEQLNTFKNSLKSSFDLNIQKLDVLDKLVQTVQMKGAIQFDSLRGSLDVLKSSKIILKGLINEQVNMTAILISEIRNSMLPDIQKLLQNFRINPSADCSKVELIDKLRKEEDSHLSDLTILSTRNKELQKDQRHIRDQLERLQLEYSDSLKLTFQQKEDYNVFMKEVKKLLTIELDDSSQSFSSQIHRISVIEKIENLISDKQNLENNIKVTKESLDHLSTDLSTIRTEFKVIQSEIFDTSEFEDCLHFTVLEVCKKFEEISQERERFFNETLNLFSRKIEQILKLQNELTHKSLSLRVNYQSQLADSNITIERLRRHCQDLTSELNQTSSEVERKRLALQVKESEVYEYKRKYEMSQERLKMLEQELSMKNQENRSFSIRIQALESELDETRVQNRHDVSALERKISILETKLSNGEIERVNINVRDTKIIGNHMKLHEFGDLDPFSSVEAAVGKDDDARRCHESTAVCLDGSDLNPDVSVIPATVLPVMKKQFMVTFTGIRDPHKQKELTTYLKNLNAIVHIGPDFNDDITHVLAPRGYKSIRVLAASLTGKWIVPIEWVEACHRAGHFVPEVLSNGFINVSIRPFRFRTLWMSAAFSATHNSHPVYPVTALRTLLEKLGKARWTETSGQADFLLVTEEEKESKLITSSRGVLLTLNNLINMVPIE